MRAYFFNNMYLSSIQQGIQAQHCTGRMFGKYRSVPNHITTPDWERRCIALYEWEKNHKTTIILNGRDTENMDEIFEHLDKEENPYPYARFCEPGIGGALTSIGIILPESVYGLASLVRTNEHPTMTTFDFEMCSILNRCPLAR